MKKVIFALAALFCVTVEPIQVQLEAYIDGGDFTRCTTIYDENHHPKYRLDYTVEDGKVIERTFGKYE